jgi:tetratricopeptide (TPR) repeat protein
VDIDTAWDFENAPGSEANFRIIAAEAMTQVARALGLQRKFDEGHAVLDEVQPITSRVEVRLLLERGRLFNSAGEVPKARMLFAEAYEEALGAHEDALAVDAAHMVAIAESGAAAKEWNEKALQQASSSADPKARKWRASLLNNLAWTYHDEGDYEHALKLFREARNCREEMNQVRLERVARWCIARCLRSLKRYDEALGMQRALLEERNLAEQSDGFIQEEIGENLVALGRDDEATSFFRTAYERLSVELAGQEKEKPRLQRLRELGSA